MIKPWYFSQSNWNTISIYNYCISKIEKSNKNYNSFSKKCRELEEKYPYLKSVEDYASKWKERSWHLVWISLVWASYLAKKWWTGEMIIKYYLRGVKVWNI